MEYLAVEIALEKEVAWGESERLCWLRIGHTLLIHFFESLCCRHCLNKMLWKSSAQPSGETCRKSSRQSFWKDNIKLSLSAYLQYHYHSFTKPENFSTIFLAEATQIFYKGKPRSACRQILVAENHRYYNTACSPPAALKTGLSTESYTLQKSQVSLRLLLK